MRGLPHNSHPTYNPYGLPNILTPSSLQGGKLNCSELILPGRTNPDAAFSLSHPCAHVCLSKTADGEQGHLGNQHLQLGLMPSAFLGRDLCLSCKPLHQGQLDHFLNSHITSAIELFRS